MSGLRLAARQLGPDWRARWRAARCLAWALLLGPGLAGAVAVAGPGGTAQQGRRQVSAAPTAGADQPALALLAARIEAVDPAGRWLQLQGQQVPLHPTALRLLDAPGAVAGGASAGVRSLRPGQAIRFALEAEPAPPPAGASAPRVGGAAGLPVLPLLRRIVLIYLETRP